MNTVDEKFSDINGVIRIP